MDLTKRQILDRNGIDFDAFEYEHEYSAKNLLTAMDEYAEQEAKAYASWLSHQVIRGRTALKIWADCKTEIGPIISA